MHTLLESITHGSFERVMGLLVRQFEHMKCQKVIRRVKKYASNHTFVTPYRVYTLIMNLSLLEGHSKRFERDEVIRSIVRSWASGPGAITSVRE